MKRSIPWVVLIAGAAVVLLLVIRDRRGSTPPSEPRGVVLITVDTLRADRVGRGFTPSIDRLAASGIRFTNARTVVPLTLPAHVSLMTGVSPVIHGVRENGRVFGGSLPTLATAFRDAGYATGAFVGAYVLDRRFGLSRGFDVYDDRVHRDPQADARLEAERRGGEVVDAAMAWVGSLEAPRFFLWMHLYDPHAPYEPPDDFREHPEANPYDREIAYADSRIAKLLAELERRGLARSSVIAVAGDHGEALGEHGEQTHGMLAYDSTLRVPLIVTAPELTPREIDAPVSLVDVAATLLRLAGVDPALSDQASDVDLLSPIADREVYAETQYPRTAGWHPLEVLANGKWKLILSSEAELYDVESDPRELTNLAGGRGATIQAMTATLQQIQAADGAASEKPQAMAPEAEARLRALGYVGGSGPPDSVDPAAPNPARMIEEWTRFERALAAMRHGDARAALADVKELAERFPSAQVFQPTYARALQDAGYPRRAVEILRAAVARWPSDASLFHDLAVAARSAGDRDEAMRAEQAALALEKDSPAALNGLGLLQADAGRPADAAATFERATRADPSNASYWSNLGNASRELGDLAAAEQAYRRALDLDPVHADAANGLGVLLVQRGQPAEAVAWFEKALHRAPDFHEARLNLGIAYQESGLRDKAADTYREILRRAPASAARERRAAAELLRSVR